LRLGLGRYNITGKINWENAVHYGASMSELYLIHVNAHSHYISEQLSVPNRRNFINSSRWNITGSIMFYAVFTVSLTSMPANLLSSIV